MPNPLVVFDCVVFLQGLINQTGPAASCLESFVQGRCSLAISPEVLSELGEVLSRPRLRQRFNLTNDKLDKLIELLLSKGSFYPNVPRRFEFPRDPDDEPYLNLAIEAGAQFLITRDRDLLDLMRSDTNEGRDFQSRFRQLRILNPVEFLQEIKALSPASS